MGQDISSNFEAITSADIGIESTFVLNGADRSSTLGPTAPPISPTSTPRNAPTMQEVIMGVAVTVAVLGAGLALLIYLLKRK